MATTTATLVMAHIMEACGGRILFSEVHIMAAAIMAMDITKTNTTNMNTADTQAGVPQGFTADIKAAMLMEDFTAEEEAMEAEAADNH